MSTKSKTLSLVSLAMLAVCACWLSCGTPLDETVPAGEPVPGQKGDQGEPGAQGVQGPAGASPFALVGNDAVLNGTVFADAFSSNSPLELQTAGTTRIFVDDTNGYIGINTTSPTGRLHVAGQLVIENGFAYFNSTQDLQGPLINLRNETPGATKAGRIHFTDAGSVVGKIVYDLADYALTFHNGAGVPERMRIDEFGRVGIGQTSPSHPLHVGTGPTNGNGAHLTAGGVWTNGSDRNSKRNFEPVDKQAILAKLADLPVTRWLYKGEAESIRHVGPMAQDFYAAFGLGGSDKHIGTVDADGVALAAIQGLYEMMQEREAQIDELSTRVKQLEAMLAESQQREIESLMAQARSLQGQLEALPGIADRLERLETAQTTSPAG